MSATSNGSPSQLARGRRRTRAVVRPRERGENQAKPAATSSTPKRANAAPRAYAPRRAVRRPSAPAPPPRPGASPSAPQRTATYRAQTPRLTPPAHALRPRIRSRTIRSNTDQAHIPAARHSRSSSRAQVLLAPATRSPPAADGCVAVSSTETSTTSVSGLRPRAGARPRCRPVPASARRRSRAPGRAARPPRGPPPRRPPRRPPRSRASRRSPRAPRPGTGPDRRR